MRIRDDQWDAIEREAAAGGISGAAQLGHALDAWFGRQRGELATMPGLGPLAAELDAAAGTPAFWFLLWREGGTDPRPLVVLGQIKAARGTVLLVDVARPAAPPMRPFTVAVPRTALVAWWRAGPDLLAELRELLDPSYGPCSHYLRHLLHAVWPDAPALVGT